MANDDKIRDPIETEPTAKSRLASSDEIEAFARDYFASEFPNSAHTGCPPLPVLRQRARTGAAPDDDLRAHLFSCSECFREFRNAVAATEPDAERQRRKFFSIFGVLSNFRQPAFAMLALFAVVAIAAVWFLRERGAQPPTALQAGASDHAPTLSTPRAPSGTIPGSEAGDNQTTRTDVSPDVSPDQTLPAARIDLRNFVALSGRERGAAASESEARPIRLAAARTRLNLRLPEGSAGGSYTIAVLDRATLRTVMSARSHSAAGRNLEATLNLDSLAPATYVLRIGRQNEAPADYLLVIERR